MDVFLPYEFTLLSNASLLFFLCCPVFLPYEFTLLSNYNHRNPCQDKFFYHMNLHYSQTSIWHCCEYAEFFYHMNLHYSQTSIFKSCHYEARYISIWLSIYHTYLYQLYTYLCLMAICYHHFL